MNLRYKRVIHWFRKDLRLTDNTALNQAAQEASEVLPVYIFSDWKKNHAWTGAARQEFLLGCLASLEKNLAALGARLIYRRGDLLESLALLVQETKAEAIYFNRDYDPYGVALEKKLTQWGRENGIAIIAKKDSVLHESHEVLTGSGGPYRVFTPYSRNWHAQPKPPVGVRLKSLTVPAKVASQPDLTLAQWGLTPSGVDFLPPGEKAARERMKLALREVVAHYQERRNTPHGQTTSRLSQDLRFGLISIRELYHECRRLQAEAPAPVQASIQVYLNELAWREFYQALLVFYPEVLEHEFDSQWRGLPWSWDEEKFNRWKEGLTGFPIVDAGMRELRATGFMHNRVRMITAMFLTKDLLIDWRLGERYFMQQLVDGEIASNNGGWQWSAGTGADAAPYFRIQNPWTQTKTYDPEGHYIRRWVPELKNVPDKALFTAVSRGQKIIGAEKSYPAPMVDHAVARDQCLAFFQRHREQTGVTPAQKSSV